MAEDILSKRVIACALAVRRELGYGFLERVYENSLVVELARSDIKVQQQRGLQVRFKGVVVGEYVADLVVEDKLLVEVKSVERLVNAHSAQLINYLRATGLTVGLLLNFGPSLVNVQRVVHAHDDTNPI